MGLFGKLGKLVGKVAKFGLSKVTHGVSDQVLKVLKGRGQVKQVLAKTGMPATVQEQALVAKLGNVVPRVLSTEQVLADAGAGGARYGAYRTARGAKGKGSRAMKRAIAALEYGPPRLAGSPVRAAPRAPKAKTAKQTARAARSKRIYAAWKDAGRPGKFFDWARVNGKAVA